MESGCTWFAVFHFPSWPTQIDDRWGRSAKPDPLFADLGNAEIESLAAHVASLR
jgi:hypothetical protein